jgi:hypothetical protein
MIRFIWHILLVVMAFAVQAAFAEGTRITIEGAKIKGDQELPTVLYLVPWQPAKVYSIDKPAQTLASSRPVKHLNRESFLRMQRYHQAFVESHSNEIKPQ